MVIALYVVMGLSRTGSPDLFWLSAGFYDEKVRDVFANEAQGRIEEFSQQNLVSLPQCTFHPTTAEDPCHNHVCSSCAPGSRDTYRPYVLFHYCPFVITSEDPGWQIYAVIIR